ncbi:hypothetical protein D3C71_1339960 [compost metagenome]
MGERNRRIHVLFQAVNHQFALSPVNFADQLDVALIIVFRHEFIGQQLREHRRMYVFPLLRYHHLLNDF